MHEGKRPGGLTALAVFNFVFGALNCLNVLVTIALIALVAAMDLDKEKTDEPESVPAAESTEDRAEPGSAPAAESTEDAEPSPEHAEEKQKPKGFREAVAEAWAQIGFGIGLLVLLALSQAALASLQITSGVGYLRQKKFLGRVLGNAYALLSIGTTIFELSVQPDNMLGGGFNLMALFAVIYPVLTLILLNTTFKDDFVN